MTENPPKNPKRDGQKPQRWPSSYIWPSWLSLSWGSWSAPQEPQDRHVSKGGCAFEGTGIAAALAVVIPAKAGIHLLGIRHTSGSWIPACAGMTESKREFLYLPGVAAAPYDLQDGQDGQIETLGLLDRLGVLGRIVPWGGYHTPTPASPRGLGSRPPSRLSFPQKRESIFLGYVTPHGSWIPACAGMTESKREFLCLPGVAAAPYDLQDGQDGQIETLGLLDRLGWVPCPRSRGHVFSTPGTCLRKRKHGTQASKTVKTVK